MLWFQNQSMKQDSKPCISQLLAFTTPKNLTKVVALKIPYFFHTLVSKPECETQLNHRNIFHMLVLKPECEKVSFLETACVNVPFLETACVKCWFLETAGVNVPFLETPFVKVSFLETACVPISFLETSSVKVSFLNKRYDFIKHDRFA